MIQESNTIVCLTIDTNANKIYCYFLSNQQYTDRQVTQHNNISKKQGPHGSQNSALQNNLIHPPTPLKHGNMS